MLNSCLILGMAIGSLMSGFTMRKIGHRKGILLALFVGILGSLVAIPVNQYYVICASRFIMGLSSGQLDAIAPKFVKDTLPSSMLGPVIASFKLSHSVSHLLVS